MSSVRTEFSATARLALPIALGLAGHGLMTTLDTTLLGHQSVDSLAACGLGANVLLPPLLFGYGILTGVSVLSAQGRGAGEHAAAPRALRAGLIVALTYGIAVAVLLHAGVAAGMTRLSGLPDPALREADGFLVALAWSTPFSFVFQAIKNAAEAAGRPWSPLRWLISGLAMNALAGWALIFGVCGLPALGATGAGLATLLGRMVMLTGLAWRERGLLRRAFVPEACGGMRAMLHFGVPCGLHWLAEVGVFCASPLLIARWFGAGPLAAYQIAISVASLAFMLPLGVSQAAGIRAGEAFGAKDFHRMKLIGRGALGFALAFMGVYAVALVASHDVIPRLFTGNAGDPATDTLAGKMLLVAAGFALADAVQVTISGLLRGIGDTRFSSGVGIVAYWVIGLPAGLLLAFPGGFGALGILLGLAGGLVFAAIMFTLRWRRLIQKLDR